jgi:hypothetical protein
MKIDLVKTAKCSLAVVAVAILAASCQKERSITKTDNEALQNAKTSVNAVPISRTITVTGKAANVATQGAAGFGTVYVNLANGAQDTVNNFPGANLQFTSYDNATIKVPAGYTLKFLYNTTKTFANLKISDFASVAAVASIGRNTSSVQIPNGWFNAGQAIEYLYIQPIQGVYLLVTPASGNSYLVQITDSQLLYLGSEFYNRGVFTIKTGVINNL